MARDLAALDVELVLEQLRLRRHGYVLAGCHGECAGHHAGEAGEAHHARRRSRPGDAEDQRDVGEQPVADAEHRGARRPTLHIAVMRPHPIGPQGTNPATGVSRRCGASRESAGPGWR